MGTTRNPRDLVLWLEFTSLWAFASLENLTFLNLTLFRLWRYLLSVLKVFATVVRQAKVRFEWGVFDPRGLQLVLSLAVVLLESVLIQQLQSGTTHQARVVQILRRRG